MLNSIHHAKDIRCKVNSVRKIDRYTCRNNCTQWNYVKNPNKLSCELGYK